MSKPPLISVVIPTYNEATYVGRLLKALEQQSFKNLEVIVSDASSKDGIEDVVSNHQPRMKVELMQTPPEGPSAGRNAGAKAAGGDWLLFLDADVDIDDPEFLQVLLDTTVDKKWSTSTTLYRVNKASILERAGAAVNLGYIRLLAHTKHPVAPGFCIFTRRELFLKNNGFDEKLYFGEDYDYVTRVAKEGFGFITGTYYYQDLRRFRQGNQYKVFFRNVLAEIYRHTHGHKIDKPPFKYEFGKHKPVIRTKQTQTEWRRHKLLIQFAEYMVGGGVYFWGGLAVFALLFDGVHASWWAAKVTADIFGWSANYLIQRYWAFADPRLAGQDRRVVFRYVFINAIDLVFDYLIVWTFIHNGLTPYAGFFTSAAFTTVWDYLWYRFWVFKPARA